MAEVLFSAELLGDPDPDVWDDTLLIKAYEEAVDPIKKSIAKKLDPTSGSSSEIKEWKLGMPVRALFSEDQKYYEADILKIFDHSCRVKYLGYNNKEIVPKKSILPSHGDAARKSQIKEAMAETELSEKTDTSNCSEAETDGTNEFDSSKPCTSECLSNKASSTKRASIHHSLPEGLPMIPPPIPPHIFGQFPHNESDLLSSMLMSWYMSGYHTGYWQGYQASKKQKRGQAGRRRY